MMFTLSFLAIFLTSFCLIRAEIRDSSVEWLYERYAFVIPLSFSFTLALIGLIANTCFYLDIPTSENIYVVYIVAVLVLPIFWKNIQHLKRANVSLTLNGREKILFAMILYMGFLYLHRALAPWSDGDEIGVYGVVTKLIANDFSYSHSDFRAGWPKFAQSLSAYFYYVSGTTIFPKIIKIIGLFITAQLLYFVTHHITRKTEYGLIASLCFLITPEFSYLASSLKTDNVVMVFEFTALAIAILLISERSLVNSRDYRKYALVAIFMTIVAVAVRISAIYCCFVVSILMAYTLFKKDKKQCQWLIGSSFLMCIPFFIGYWVNLASYHNPIYPLHFAFMDYFVEAEYRLGWDIAYQRAELNIDLSNKILEFVYVAAYASFGLGTGVFDSFSQIIHPVTKGAAYGWSNPVLIAVFCLPFLVRENRRLVWPVAIFLSLYALWFSGVHYTRLFLASTALAVLCYVCCMERVYESVARRGIRNLLILYLIVIIPTFMVYHTLYTFVRMPNNVLTVVNRNEAYDSNVRYYNFMRESLGMDFDPFVLSFDNVREVDRFMRGKKRLRVSTSINGPVHMFFKYGDFGGNDGTAKHLPPGYVVDNECFIGKESEGEKPVEMFEVLDLDEYKMWCRETET